MAKYSPETKELVAQAIEELNEFNNGQFIKFTHYSTEYEQIIITDEEEWEETVIVSIFRNNNGFDYTVNSKGFLDKIIYPESTCERGFYEL